jgi:hypothetical protein
VLFRLAPPVLGTAELFEQARTLLAVHGSIERQVLYPLVAGALAGGRAIRRDMLTAHREVDTVLERLRSLDIEAPEFRVDLLELAGNVRDHNNDEEQQLFPALRRVLDAKQLRALGTQLERARGRAPTRPHPKAPAAGTRSRTLARAVRAGDALRDRLARRL